MDEYAFLREGWHPLIGFLYGWTLLLVISPGGTAAVTMKFAQTLATLVPGLALPWAVKLTGLAAIWGLAIVNYFGVKPGALVQNIFTAGKPVALALLIGFGFLSKGSHTQTPTSPYEGSVITAFGAALAAVYVSAAAVYLHVLPLDAIRHTETLATDAGVRVLGDFGARFISVAIVVSTFGFIDMTLLTAPRVFYAMGRDGYLFPAAAYVHPKYKSPVTMLLFFAAWTSVVFLAGSYDALLSYTTFGDWIFFGLAVGAVFTLRRRYPDLHRPYRVWGYPLLPAAFVCAAFGFVLINFFANQPQTSYGLGLILTGIPAFYFFRKFNAKNRLHGMGKDSPARTI